MEIFVPDASVILKWTIGLESEPDQEEAVTILDAWITGKIEIALPELWAFEVANFLGRIAPDSALEKMEILLNFRFKTRDLDRKICKLVFELMKNLSVSFYDASYHALAKEIGGVFITADNRYYDKAKSLGNIELLGSLRIKS
jgi:predicted nucleic acid-binding protein